MPAPSRVYGAPSGDPSRPGAGAVARHRVAFGCITPNISCSLQPLFTCWGQALRPVDCPASPSASGAGRYLVPKFPSGHLSSAEPFHTPLLFATACYRRYSGIFLSHARPAFTAMQQRERGHPRGCGGHSGPRSLRSGPLWLGREAAPGGPGPPQCQHSHSHHAKPPRLPFSSGTEPAPSIPAASPVLQPGAALPGPGLELGALSPAASPGFYLLTWHHTRGRRRVSVQ